MQAEILAERVALDEQIAIALRAIAVGEHGEHGIVRSPVGGEPNLPHLRTRIKAESMLIRRGRFLGRRA